MSGGFFRGTSADQDTRFSNKQAKLLKTQKFASELDHLVDMTKVKMDVMKPWIARRVTELLGFEDEVLINFVYGLLDAKEVDGKQIQIQLTGFMEKNTGKFMRELWGLLLSAQKNASGVPQQFLDEKEEEMRKKKVESDRITQEIQKKKDREDLEADYAKQKRMDGEADSTRHVDAASDAGPKNSVWRDSSANLEEQREIDGRHGSTRTSRHRSISPRSDNQSPLLQRNSLAKSSSRSFSNSRSYSESEDGHKSKSVSVSASPPRRSTSQDQRRRSRAKYSVSPNQRRSPQITQSASRQRSPYLGRSPSPVRHRPPSPVRRRSPSPVRRRSPIRVRRRSPSLHRRSPTSFRRRSPAPRRRSPSPPRRHSPPRPRYQSPQHRYRRSPSPSWHRFPLRRRSPIKFRRRSPSPAREISPQRRSQSPARRRSPSPFRRRSPLPRSPARRRGSPLHHAVDLRSSPRQRNMSKMQNAQRSRSPSQSHGSLSMEHANHGDGVESERNRRSPLHSLKRDKNEKADFGSSRIDSPSSEQWQNARSETNVKKSHSLSCEGDMNKSGNSGRGLSRSPARQSRGRKDRYNSLEASRGENPDAREGSYQKAHSSSKRSPYSPTRANEKLSRRTNSGDPERVEVKESLKVRGNQVDVKLKEHHEQRRNVEHSGSRIEQVSHLPEDVEYGPGKVDGNFLPDGPNNKRSSRKRQGSSSPDERPRNEKNHLENSFSKEASRTDEKKRFHIEDKSNYAKKSRKQLDESYQVCPADTDSEEDGIKRSHANEKRSKKSEINEAASEDYDSALDRRKEAKRKRKEERRLRKEEKRRRRDEKHRRREERRAQKNSKYIDTVTLPPDYEINNSVVNNSDEAAGLRVSKTSDMEETESEQKQLEIDLRNKALESLRAKKAISH